MIVSIFHREGVDGVGEEAMVWGRVGTGWRDWSVGEGGVLGMEDSDVWGWGQGGHGKLA